MRPEIEDWDERPDELRSCDKGSHLLRSLANQPNHLKYWRKTKAPLLNDKESPPSRSSGEPIVSETILPLQG